MLQLPPESLNQISAFAFAFTKPTWEKAKALLIGAILCPGSRTVCNVLRTIGLKGEKSFDKYHAVLYRARWSPLKLSSVLLGLLATAFLRDGEPLVFGVDETIERRWGYRIAKRGIYRDAVRSSASHLGVETQRQWSELSIERATPVLMALKSIVCLFGRELWAKGKLEIQTAAWYDKTHFTFSDVLYAVRRHIWMKSKLPTSAKKSYVGSLKQRIRYLEQALLSAVA